MAVPIEAASADDASLLKRFVDSRDQRAFEQLVARNIDLVYAAARRQARGDLHLAEDITQAVFVLLARKAPSVRDAAALPGWLLSTTRFIARDALRAEARRMRRENEASKIMTRVFDPGSSQSPSDRERIAPLLDDALSRLREGDRILVTLRFLKEMSIAEVAAATGLSAAVAQKRIARAVARMRDSFARRGIVLSAAGTCSALSQSVEHAPPHLAHKAAASALAAQASLASTSLLSLKLMSLLTSKIAAGIAAAVVLFGTASVVLMARTPSHQVIGPATEPSRIKVGVLLSEMTAESWHGTGSEWDLSHQRTILSLRSPRLDLYVIFEPGPQKIMAAQGRRFVPADHFLNGADPAALRKLDVIVAGHCWHMRNDVLDAMTKVVRDDGVGLLEQSGFGMYTPSFTPPVIALSGLSNDQQTQYFFRTDDTIATVVADHPLLKGLKLGDQMHVPAACGAFGAINGTPLIAAFNAADEPEPNRMEYLAKVLKRPTTAPVSADALEDGPVFCPLYVSQLGRGRIVSCQWHNNPPAALDPKQDGTFYLHCIEWLAGRPIE